jgi:succinate-acetate transporter protein
MNKLTIINLILGLLCYTFLLLSVTFNFRTENQIVFSTSAIIFTFLGVDGLRNDEEQE